MKEICSVENCHRIVKGRSLCEAHLLRLRKRGTVDAHIPIESRSQDTQERLLAHVDKETLPGCWLWAGSCLPDGYGSTFTGSRKDGSRRSARAHRLSYEVFVGAIPDEMHLDHTCHSRDQSCLGGDECLHRRCINPDHLEPVTPLLNARRSKKAESARRAMEARTTCMRGHEYTPENTIWYKGNRWCRPCNRFRAERKKAKRSVA